MNTRTFRHIDDKLKRASRILCDSLVILAIQTQSGENEEPITPAGMNDHLSLIKALLLWSLLDSYDAIMSGNVRLEEENLTQNGNARARARTF